MQINSKKLWFTITTFCQIYPARSLMHLYDENTKAMIRLFRPRKQNKSIVIDCTKKGGTICCNDKCARFELLALSSRSDISFSSVMLKPCLTSQYYMGQRRHQFSMKFVIEKLL